MTLREMVECWRDEAKKSVKFGCDDQFLYRQIGLMLAYNQVLAALEQETAAHREEAMG